MNKGRTTTLKLLLVPAAIAITAVALILSVQPARQTTVPAVSPSNQLPAVFDVQRPTFVISSDAFQAEPIEGQVQLTKKYIFTDRSKFDLTEKVIGHPRLDLIDKVN